LFVYFFLSYENYTIIMNIINDICNIINTENESAADILNKVENLFKKNKLLSNKINIFVTLLHLKREISNEIKFHFLNLI